jgi:hypothetical protein
MPYIGAFGGANAPPILVSQAVADSVASKGGGFFDTLSDLSYNVKDAAVALAPAALSIVAAPFTGGASLFSYAANAALDAAATESDFLQQNKQLIKLATTASRLAYGDGTTAVTLEGESMGFFDDIFDSAADLLPSNAGIDYGAILNAGVGAGIRALNNYGTGSQGTPSIMPSSLAGMPAVMTVGGAVAVRAGSAIAARLATMGLTRAKAYSLLRRYGPASLTAIGLTALEVAQVAQGGSGRRRMNMCNGRALRRAQRRIDSFHRFYKKTCGVPSVHRRKKSCK